MTRLEKHAECDSRLQATLDTLLERAEIVGPEAMKSNVITMNSRVTLTDDTTRAAITWTLVYPDQASLDTGKLNVFSPVGLALLGALLGARKGERVAVALPNTSTGTVTVSAIVSQPEASGDYTR